MSFSDVDFAKVKSQIINLLSVDPEMTEDEQLFIDMLEAETDFFVFIAKLVEKKLLAASYEKAMKDLAQNYLLRGASHGKREVRYSNLIKSALVFAGLRSINLPIATIYMRNGTNKAIVPDVNELSQGYYKTERKPDMAAIKKDLENGVDVPGAHLEVGPETITIRTK